MILRPTVELDGRDAAKIVEQLLERRPGYVPEWQVEDGTASAAIARIFARYLYAIIQRLNQAPEKNKLAFLDLLGLSLVAAQASRAPIVFEAQANGSDAQAPAGTQVAAPPPPEGGDQIVFETERAGAVARAKLKEVVSLWPGRDQYINHSKAFLAGLPFQLFRKADLVDTPHEIYIAHDTLLALAGNVSLEVEFELTRPSGEHLSILWQYWDGAVWRGFKSARPACSEKEAAHADSTNGLRASGRFRLETECAKSAKTTVNGVEAYWIRGRLTEPLPPDPSTPLPLVEGVRLTSIIDQSLKATLTPIIRSDLPNSDSQPGTVIQGRVMNEAGRLLAHRDVKITSPDDPNFEQKKFRTNPRGEFNIPPNSGQPDRIDSQPNYKVQVSFLNLEATGRLRNIEPDRTLEVDLIFNVTGLDPDKAFADATELDVTKPFFPFGQQPQPGSAFYFTLEEAFTKPGAKVQIYVARTASPQDELGVTTAQAGGRGSAQSETKLPHLISWEYWNGRRWATMFQSTEDSKDFEQTEIIELTIPDDMAPMEVNDEEALWMRARIVSGGFGFTQRVTWEDGNTTNEFTYVIARPPSIAAFRIGYTWQYGPFNPERVLTHNDFQYEDNTFASIWPGNPFLAFKRVSDVTPALYLGFDQKLPVDRIGMYFDIAEQREETRGPAMVWEYFDGSAWREVSVEDETRGLRLPGVFSFIAAPDSQKLARFGTPLHWLRGRFKEDGPPGEPLIKAIFTNAVWASQQRTLVDTPLGASTGLPDQAFLFTQVPVLAGERIEVQELSSARANVEWRILAREIYPDDPNVIRDIEEMLGREGEQTDVIRGDLRLQRDRNKRVVAVFVRWAEQPHLFLSGPEDRHYVIDRARGLVFFGDGASGKIPPPGAQILARRHRAGGGLAGNVAARAITQLLGAVPGVQSVFNPTPAEGGADGESLERFSLRGPKTVRHRGRAISPADYETLAYEASPAVAVARAIPARNASGRRIPGWITLLIIPQSKERLPLPTFGLREHVRRYVEQRAPASIAAAAQIYVTGPNYLPIDVEATIAPVDASEAGSVERRARAALEEFLHPLRGGPDGRGWDLGRDVFISDVAAVLEGVEGVDYVKELALFLDGQLKGDRVNVATDRIVVAGEIRLRLTQAEE